VTRQRSQCAAASSCQQAMAKDNLSCGEPVRQTVSWQRARSNILRSICLTKLFARVSIARHGAMLEYSRGTYAQR